MTKNLKLALLAATALAVTPATFASNAQEGHQDPQPKVYTLAEIRAANLVEEETRDPNQKAAIEFAETQATKFKKGEGLCYEGLEAIDSLMGGFLDMFVEMGLLEPKDVILEEGEDLLSQTARTMRTFAESQLTAVSKLDHDEAVKQAEKEAKKDMVERSAAKTAVDTAYTAGQMRAHLASVFANGYDHTDATMLAFVEAVKTADTEKTLGIDALDTKSNADVKAKLDDVILDYAARSTVDAVTQAIGKLQLPQPKESVDVKKLRASLSALKAQTMTKKLKAADFDALLALLPDQQ